jgi:malate dehydrogenase (oxaloacetate-decarboxylating)
LAFPGIFKGVLRSGIRTITDEHKLAAAHALAALIPSPTADRVLPWPLEPGIAEHVAKAVESVG